MERTKAGLLEQVEAAAVEAAGLGVQITREQRELSIQEAVAVAVQLDQILLDEQAAQAAPVS